MRRKGKSQVAETVRMYEPHAGRLPPSARFHVKNNGCVALDFTYQAVERFGLGTEFLSANLYHVMDSDLDAQRIMMELFPEQSQGQRRLTQHILNKRARIHVTKFVEQFEVPFKEHCRYSVWATGNHLYVDL